MRGKNLTVFLCVALGLSGCGGAAPDASAELQKRVAANRIGHDRDQWIEISNLSGEWERTGLIFGYADDQGECQKAIAGMKAANPKREYRCSPAN